MQTCFVVMGFGEKTDLATGRKFNLDKTYKNIIKPAVSDAGYNCIRADEVQHSGVIDIPMYKLLFDADLVVADLSTSNPNALFELGVRYGLKPRSTIIIAENGFNASFDVNHIVIRKYEHLGVDIAMGEGVRMRKALGDLAKALKENQDPDSPVYALIHDLVPPRRGPQRPIVGSQETSPPDSQAPMPDPDSFGALIDVALQANGEGQFHIAKPILERIYQEQTQTGRDGARNRPRPRVVQQLAFATYKLGDKGAIPPLQAYERAIELLRELDPERTTDPETLGLWSAVHKRRFDIETRDETDRRADLDIAIAATERGFLIRQDHYNGGNLAFLLDTRAARSAGDDQVADRVVATRVRIKVLAITKARLASMGDSSRTGDNKDLLDEFYWNTASNAEALVGLGRASIGEAHDRLKPVAPHEWMLNTSIEQMNKLAKLRPADVKR